ncbi:hypothetical protein MTR67_020142 [Solanum verrucosum]|uniref:Reverse transcriptase domain-containing protein n=1 Tax=Solanum verrucosum TaxID=315347 RepID=A0AAF0QMS0_SOLVR|nr:hypothetical protein MTR67_020142 [Solanum verrucosum]
MVQPPYDAKTRRKPRFVGRKPGAVELKDFRPISLIGGVYKIISKLITERLKTVIGKLVDEHQMAFLKGRQILDASLLTNEPVDSRVKQKQPGILCKLDIEKAYDHVNWNFLLKILKDMGFGEQQNANRWVKGFSAQTGRGEDLEVSHLFYADDALIFCEAETSQIKHLRAILTIFEGISGLHVNWLKSHISPINQVGNLQDLAVILGCQVDSLPTKYFGLPLGAKNKELEVWSGVLERCENKQSRWKSQYLSLGGRLTLTKSVLDGMPTYMMSLFSIPKSIEKKLNRVRRAFLWQGNKEKRGYNLVKWDEPTLNTQQGGLNLKNLSKQNTSLLQKWLWRFSSEERAIWRRFIAGKYGLLNHWTTEEVAGTFGCSVWKTIRRLWPYFNNNMSITVGNGLKTDFWNEVWIGEDSLRNSFSHLYILSTQRNVYPKLGVNRDGTLFFEEH